MWLVDAGTLRSQSRMDSDSKRPEGKRQRPPGGRFGEPNGGRLHR